MRIVLNLGAEASQSVALVNVPKDDRDDYQNPQPKSGINFVAYDQSFKVVPENTGVLLVEDKINEIQTLYSDNLIMKEAGFIEIYTNNEAQTPVYYDNLMVAQSSSRALEVNAYYPYGMIIPELSSPAPSPDERNFYKFSGKELQEELGYLVYSFGHRDLRRDVPVFTTPDRFAEKYYHLSPYSYAANNPANLIDVNGDSIWITMYGENGMIDKMLYTPGMKYKGDNAFFKNSVSMLNNMNSVKAGSVVIGSLHSSENKYYYTNGIPKDGSAASTQEFNDGRSVYFSMGNGTSLENTAHELFHGYQMENGVGGQSVVNEIEAYAFGYAVAYNYALENYSESQMFLNNIEKSVGRGGVMGFMGSSYDNAFKDLMSGNVLTANRGYDQAARWFIGGSRANARGLYNTYPFQGTNRNRGLLRPFFPLIK